MGDFQNAYEITSAERADKGVMGLPDTPGLSTGDMQARFDSLGNLSIDKFNLLVAAFGDVISNDPLKAPTMKAIVDYVSSLGGGDMMKAVYDTDNSGVVDNAEQLGGHGANYYRLIGDNAGGHNSVFRGKNLGSSVTADQYAAISAGTFDDLYIGDFWTINGVTWRIAHFDYWLGTGYPLCNTHHIVLVPDSTLYATAMNDTETTAGGYYNSKMRGGANYLVNGLSNLYSASQTIEGAFGSSHILTHHVALTTGSDSNGASSWNWWYASTIDLMNEIMVYGCPVWAVKSGYEAGCEKGQLSLFKFNSGYLSNASYWWLRSIINDKNFAMVDGKSGCPSYLSASAAQGGVRPAFAIKA